ncbi:occlusion-derived virus envelope protein 25 [Helicoverpa armigera NPV NNg1]|uniref:Occlusion-derived virus envelope protein 25 n=2 Tax=Helicoverpa armigera nucleopolyhedrovirus TaxID=51313 RepID=B5X079_9ABAC|nr:occlusion derived virus envelope protein 25 [Helicoverpa armigera nucleopolyhedrovirus]BAG74649.1 occlusion-derived virus envelope protein 25 [Helicoverpa armigera NPV NNg1]
MIGTIVLILIVLAVLYWLYTNNKLNFDSLNDSSGQSSESIRENNQGQLTLKFNSPRIKTMRILHGDNKISKVCVAERPLTYSEIIDEGNRTVGANCVFMGTISEPSQTSTLNQQQQQQQQSAGSSLPTTANRVTANFDIKQFKNTFIVFKNVEMIKIKESANMVRYESDGMVYCLIDSQSTTVPDLREVSYPIVVYTTNANVQLKLKEWSYAQINDAGTMFVKNETSFRIQ